MLFSANRNVQLEDPSTMLNAIGRFFWLRPKTFAHRQDVAFQGTDSNIACTRLNTVAISRQVFCSLFGNGPISLNAAGYFCSIHFNQDDPLADNGQPDGDS